MKIYIFNETVGGDRVFCAYRNEDMTGYICLGSTLDECRKAAINKAVIKAPVLVEEIEV